METKRKRHGTPSAQSVRRTFRGRRAKDAYYGYVYFVESPTLRMVKIGHAVDMKERMARLQCGSADKLVLRAYLKTDNSAGFEAAYHARFWRSREHGEWFRLTPAIREEIERLQSINETMRELGGEVIQLNYAPRPPEPGALQVTRREGETHDDFADRVFVEYQAWEASRAA